ncbi:transcription antiterminator [Bacillus wiedmannii]|uniref:antiterminator LoaP n=1 Tax=Bacillus wiedmannii TaxID=1890302 RepID=UPI000BF3EE47|nr:antiterminator LoaP [Bacillus wiedmannii]PEU20730.1 transcription antiterminator [Bacillus wiedmannii]
MDWYVLFVENGKEEMVQKYLQLYFNENSLYSVIPKRKVPEKKFGSVFHVIKKMFPGYVFINTNMNAFIFHKIKTLPGCYRLLNCGKYYSQENGSHYSKIEKNEIDQILRLMDNNGIIDYSKIYLTDSKVFVESGPLKEMEGIIKKIDKRKNRAKILLNLLGTERLIDIGIEILSKPK